MSVVSSPEALLQKKYEKLTGKYYVNGALKITVPDGMSGEQAEAKEAKILLKIRTLLEELRERYPEKMNSGRYWYCPKRERLRDQIVGFGVDKTAQTKTSLHKSKANEASDNCSLCTAAAIITECTGKLWNTTMVAQSLALKAPENYGVERLFADYAALEEDPKHELTEDRNDLSSQCSDANNLLQLKGLASWCQKMAGVVLLGQLGSINVPMKAGLAMAQMLKYNEGTLFAVRLTGLRVSHFNFAKRTQQTLVFIDYQTDRTEVLGSKPSVGTRPLKPEGKEIAEEELKNFKIVALAFQPSKQGVKN